MAREILTLGNNGRLALAGPDGKTRSVPEPAAHTSGSRHTAYLLFDCSISMQSSMAEARSGAMNFCNGAIKQGYRVGVISFASDAIFRCDPTSDADAIQRELDKLSANGSTAMHKAIDLSVSRLSNGNGTRAIVIATDGEPDSKDSALSAAQLARKAGIEIIAIGTADADHEFLTRIASRSDLAVKVDRKQFAAAITSAARMLPP